MNETRAEKAQRLVDEGRVEVWLRTESATRAYVNEDECQYLIVLYPSGRFFCECDGGAYHPHTDNLCAHALALRLAVKKEG